MSIQDEQNKLEKDKEQSGFEKLKNFFANLPDSDKFKTDKYGNPIIDLSWFFTEDLSREIVKETMARLFIENNRNYLYSCQMVGKNITDISDIIVKTYDDQFSLIFKGADKWSKMQVVGTKSDEKPYKIPTIDFTQFQDEISKTISLKENPDFKPFRKGIGPNLDNACKNLVSYYEYLIEYKNSIPESSCFISSPEPTGNTRMPRQLHESSTPYERLNDIIPPSKRFQTLESYKPIHKIIINQKHQNGSIEQNAYHVYIYHNNLLKSIPGESKLGYLFVCEPLAGDKQTRIFYTSPEDFTRRSNELNATSIQKVYHSFVQEHLELSRFDYKKKGNNAALVHTSFETYKDVIGFYLTGTPKGPTKSFLKQYQPFLQHLYQDSELRIPGYKPRLTKENIAILGQESLTGHIDRTAQEAIEKNQTKDNTSINIPEQ